MTDTITEENTVTTPETVTEANTATETNSTETSNTTEANHAETTTTVEANSTEAATATERSTSTENVSTAQAAPEPQPEVDPQPQTIPEPTPVSEPIPEPQPTRAAQAAPAFDSSSEPEMDPFDKAEKERDSSGVFARFSAKIASIHSRREAKLVRDEIILSRIPDTDLMEYLKLEQKRLESQQRAREIREKRIWIAFQMTVALIAAVLVIYFLKDSPAILISILYTAGLLIAFNIWNKHKDGRSPKDQ